VSEISPNTAISHYLIISKLGSGGMGEVYLAQDAKLDRKVALKILPSALAANQDRMRRFVQEAKCAAALNHPNIAHIYEIGVAENRDSNQTLERDSIHFIAMEFIDGHTLREEIHQERTPLKKLLKYLHQVTDGLAKAHAAGIIHRDLKPDNIMISRDGHAKILDFGLAKLVEATERRLDPEEVDSQFATFAMRQGHTSPGAIMGTVGYMSPEQVKAKTIDQRSDIFSFGCLLYEAVTGRKPFAGDSAVDTLHKILHDPAPAIADSNPNAPAELQRIIRRCLTKEPEKRYQTIRDTANDLEEVIEELKGVTDIDRSVVPSASIEKRTRETDEKVSGSTAAATTISGNRKSSGDASSLSNTKSHRIVLTAIIAIAVLAIVASAYVYLTRRGNSVAKNSIAVLPFQNAAGDPNMEYLSDGISESLINSLSQLPNLRVLARSTTFRFKGHDTDPLTIGRQLGVDAVLTGKVVQVGDSLSVQADLVNVADGSQLWGERYSRRPSDLVVLQREIAIDVLNKLRVKLSGIDEQKLAKNYTENADANHLYLKGRFHWNRRTRKDIEKSFEYFQQAIVIDPNYVLAYVGIAEAYMTQQLFPTQTHETMSKARENAQKALSLDDNSAEAHTALGRVLAQYDYKFAAAEREYQRAIELNPNYANAHHWYGRLLMILGRWDAAFAEHRRALDLEPLSLIDNTNYANLLINVRRYDEAIAHLQKTLELDENFIATYGNLATAYWLQGNHAESVKSLARTREINGEQEVAALMRESFAKGGWEGYLRYMSEDPQPAQTAYSRATFYAARGEKDKAFAELNRSYENREAALSSLKVSPLLDPLRSDPRFAELVRKVGLPDN
jgi:serine/threonine protein kinase/tetratricopeptide (TPR) repeat protein